MRGMNESGPIRRADAPDTIQIDGAVARPVEAPRTAGPLGALIDDAGPTGDHATLHSGDGLFQASIPLEIVRAGALDDGGRMQIADSPTKCWLVKDVRRVEITDGRQPDSLPDEERAKT